MKGCHNAGLLGVFLTLGSTLSSCAVPPQGSEDLHGFVARYIETMEGADDAAIRDLFVADARFAWFTDGAQAYASADDVLAGLRQYEGVTFRTTLRDVRAEGLDGAHGSVSAGFETRLTLPESDDVVFGGVITMLTERDAGTGTWRVLVGHTSTPKPR